MCIFKETLHLQVVSSSTIFFLFSLKFLCTFFFIIMYIEDIIAACRRDQDALQDLSLDTVTYRCPSPFNTSPMSLQSAYQHIRHTTVAARELELATLECQCNMSLMLIRAVAEDNNINLQHTIHGADMAEIMLALIDEETTGLRAIQPTTREEQSDPDEQNSTSPLFIAPPTTSSPVPSASINLKSSSSGATDSRPSPTKPANNPPSSTTSAATTTQQPPPSSAIHAPRKPSPSSSKTPSSLRPTPYKETFL